MLSMKPKLNGIWSTGANFRLYLSSQPSGSTQEAVLRPWFGSQPGRYVNIPDVHSPQLGNDRHLVVYLPPSWDENPYIHYDLIIAQDGQNLFNDSTAFGGVSWRCDRTIDDLVREGKMRELVMVGVDNTGANRINEYTYSADPKYGDILTHHTFCLIFTHDLPKCKRSLDTSRLISGGGKAALYLRFLRETVLPLIGKSFSRADGDVSVLGSSLGGLFACWAAWTHPQVFSSAVCMSSSFWWNKNDFNRTSFSSIRCIGHI